MFEELLEDVLRALDVVVLEAKLDGSYTTMSPVPPWFRWVSQGDTFPFLGTFMPEAQEFWRKRERGHITSGLCAAVDGEGHEFHYEVWALTLRSGYYLVFERARGADELREMLQKAREEVLARAAAEKRVHALEQRIAALGHQVSAGLDRIAALAAGPAARDTAAQERLDRIRMTVESLRPAFATDDDR
jgi:hypothetical protein